MRRRLKKLWRAILGAMLVVVLVFFPYELYSAWTLKKIYVSQRMAMITVSRWGWIDYNVDPLKFWLVVFIYFVLSGMAATLAVLIVWSYRREQRLFLRRAAHPLAENKISQTPSER